MSFGANPPQGTRIRLPACSHRPLGHRPASLLLLTGMVQAAQHPSGLSYQARLGTPVQCVPLPGNATKAAHTTGNINTIKMKGDAAYSTGGTRQKQEGKLWDSVKTTGVILGPGLLMFAAFRNSVTWHLQKFWGASGDFWQAQWEQAHRLLGGNEWAIFLLGTALVPSLVYWSFNGLLLVADVTGKPSFITRYRIQLGKNDPVDTVKLRQAVHTVLLNQVFISLPMVMLMLPIMKWRGQPCRKELPTFHWFLLELSVCVLLEEILFYYSHRLVHHPLLYKRIHKKHHEWTAPIGVVSLYAHPVEHVFSNMLPLLVGPIILGSHVASIMVWLCLAILATSISHCGYHLPFLPSPEFHDFHHLKFNQCYGVLGVLDRLHGTDTLFKQTKAYERHQVLLSLTPLTESIPDGPKKAK